MEQMECWNALQGNIEAPDGNFTAVWSQDSGTGLWTLKLTTNNGKTLGSVTVDGQTITFTSNTTEATLNGIQVPIFNVCKLEIERHQSIVPNTTTSTVAPSSTAATTTTTVGVLDTVETVPNTTTTIQPVVLIPPLVIHNTTTTVGKVQPTLPTTGGGWHEGLNIGAGSCLALGMILIVLGRKCKSKKI